MGSPLKRGLFTFLKKVYFQLSSNLLKTLLIPKELDTMAEQLEKQLGQLKLTTDKPDLESNKQNAPKKSSSIFLTKKFNSLSQRKPPSKQSQLSFSSKTILTDKNAFFRDSPLPVDDKSWSEKRPLAIGKPIENPMAQNDKLDHRENIQFVSSSSGFGKFASRDSPFKDPYSSLNNSKVERAGADFLDNPSKYNKEQKLADKLIESLGAEDDAKELEKLETETIDEKDRKVKGLSVNLMDHQVHGLKFLRSREKNDVLKKGGLLCDDMGLGKTIQTIALIVKNGVKDDEDLKHYNDVKDAATINGTVPLRKFRATLVICPVSLASQWIQEIKKFAPHLSTALYHGPNRASSYKELQHLDVVVSSYDTVRSDFGSNIKTSPLYQGYWHRIVLDEAHVIRNAKSKTAIAVYSLESLRRWCLTGTPIQNSIDELQSLFQFLRISDLSDVGTWKSKISGLLKRGNTVGAFDLLKKELDVIMLRRTKAILKSTNFNLPEKRIHNTEVIFSEMEQQFYDDMSSNFISTLKNRLSVDEQSEKKQTKKITVSRTDVDSFQKSVSAPKNKEKSKSDKRDTYMYALVCLLRLRQICCHWKLLADSGPEDTEGRKEAVSPVTCMSPSKKAVNIDQELDGLTSFMSSLTVNDIKCEICLVEKVKPDVKICMYCTEKIEKNRKTESAKVLKLIEILQKDPTRKTIVFSQFRQVLLLLGPVLKDYGINIVMYDGQMNMKQKDAALQKLRNDKDTTVLLCSLMSGAVGLNLTVASQVVIFDPWWNPQIQEQAIDRVHRIGQTTEVDVYVFAVKGTVELRILELQEMKKQLAKTITDNNSSSKAALNSLSQSELMKVFGIYK